MKTLILASNSPRRKSLFDQLSIPFRTESPGCIEPDSFYGEKPEDFACRCALMKASEVALRYPESIVLGADTIVVQDQTILGKPHSAAEAENMIRFLSGKEHFVITGVAFIRPSSEDIVSYSKTRVIFRNLSPEEIIWYTKTRDGLDKAGAYGIQSLGGFLVKEIHGDWFNVVGLPIPLILDMLKLVDIWPPGKQNGYTDA
ncbi:MAG: Maf family protein [bacterium]